MATPQHADPNVRLYLKDKDVANLLEAFVMALVEDRPTDVFAYMEEYAQKKQGKTPPPVQEEEKAAATESEKKEEEQTQQQQQQQQPAATSDADQKEEADEPDTPTKKSTDPINDVRASWQQIEDKKALSDNFFKILFAQHNVVKKTVLKDITDYNALTERHVEILGKVIDGTADEETLLELSREHAAPRKLRQRHFDYYITAMLMALSMAIPAESYDAVSESWRIVLTDLTKIVGSVACASEDEASAILSNSGVMVETPRDAAEEGTAAERDSREPSVVVRDFWFALDADKRAQVCKTFFQILFTQHPAVKKTLFKDIPDTDALVDTHVALLSGYIDSEDIDAVAQAVKEHGVPRKLQARHHDYYITAMLTSLAIVAGDTEDGMAKVDASAEAWRRVLAMAAAKVMPSMPDEKDGEPVL